ncbi:MAG: MerR family transcriptional regulator [Deltaproteobacteria bacterium]|nr:MerR family transcriptional regulator [Deltaproteobacteria bacterium]
MKHPVEPKAALKVAAVARRTGVSVRTLHYYEEIGLLKPSSRTSAGHRLYTPADIQRLQQIRSLQQLGLPLSDIGDCLAEERFDARKVISDHLAKVEEQRCALERLEAQLRKLSDQLECDGLGDAQTTETLLNALELITMYDKYFTPAQQQRLEGHEESGEETVTPVIQELEAARKRGLPPSDAEAQRLWQRFQEAVESVTGGDAEMTAAIYKLLHSEQKAREDHGISEELFAYLGSIAGGPDH